MSMGGCILKYELVQQTPMIHFQHNETGACIRASELKPKLDRFLIKKYGRDKLENYFIDSTNGKEALRYKVSILAPITESPIKSKTNF